MNYFSYQTEILFVFLGTLMDRREFRLDGINNRSFTIKTAYTRTSTTFLDPGTNPFIGVYLMQFPYRTLFRIAWISAPDSGRIGRHRAEFLLNLVRIFA